MSTTPTAYSNIAAPPFPLGFVTGDDDPSPCHTYDTLLYP